MIYEEKLGGGLVLLQDTELTRIGTDSLALGGFFRLPRGAKVCDLGAGTGVLGILALLRDRSCAVTGLELDSRACALAQASARRNGLAGQVTTLCGDLRAVKTLLPAGSFDCVVSNPPYFADGPASQTPGRTAARREDCCTLTDLCTAAAWLLQTGGSFSLVYRPERLTDLLCALRAARLEPKRLRTVRHHAGAGVSLILVEARRGGKPGLVWEPDLLLQQADGSPDESWQALFPRRTSPSGETERLE